jgi:hypothetical protein
MRPIIAEMLSRGSPVRILLLHHKDDYVRVRSEMLARRVQDLLDDSYRNIVGIYNACKDEHKTNLHLRLFKGAPPFSLYGFDDRLFCGLYYVAKPAVEGVQFEVPRPTELGAMLSDQFEELWNRSGPDCDLTRRVSEL